MVNTTITQNEVAEQIQVRAQRGHELLLRKKQLIEQVSAEVYRVPSCRGGRSYTVRYGGEHEGCTCTDYQVRRGEVACKHLACVALMHAVRRRVVSRCQVCGVSSCERTLSGRRGDRRRGGPRWCLKHHPESLASFTSVLAPATRAGDPFLAAVS